MVASAWSLLVVAWVSRIAIERVYQQFGGFVPLSQVMPLAIGWYLAAIQWPGRKGRGSELCCQAA